jgi:S1-C subfamily serine protease
MVPTEAASETVPEPSTSTIERVRLRRSVRTATVAAGVAIAAAIAVVALFVTGVLGGEDTQTTPTTPTTAELDIPAIIDAARPSTGFVSVSQDGTPVGSGTGWVLDAGEGFVVTNQHVVNGGSTFSVRIADRDRQATVVASAPCDDLALLRVTDTEGLRSVRLGSQADLRQGETVVAVGFPASASETPNLTATNGLVSVVRESFDLRAIDVPQYPNVIQTDAAINPGNSGGPLFDTRGRLVGVNSAGITLLSGRTIQGQGYAIGVDRVKEVLASLTAGTSIGWTGMAFDYREGAPGLVVVDAVPGTPADLAGFGDGEVLVRSVNGVSLDNSLPSYCDAVKGIVAGESAVFGIERPNGATDDVRVAFHGKPPPQ